MAKLKNKIYISGPMSGYPKFNFPAFNAAEEWVKSDAGQRVLGAVEPVNPARNFDGKTTLNREDYLELALRQVDECQHILMLPGWEDSHGARLELKRAMHNGSVIWIWRNGGPEGLVPVHIITATRAARMLAEHPMPVPPTLTVESEPICNWEFDLLSGKIPTAGEERRTRPSDAAHPVENLCNAEPIEQEAGRIVRNGARQGTYGHPRGDFDTIARMWSAIITKRTGHDVTIDAELVALLMTALKLSRLARDPHHRDSKVDVIGYMICLDRLDEPHDES